MSEIITAKEFITQTFNTDFLTSDELETIVKAMNLFAIGKCREQKNICHNSYMNVSNSKLDEEEAILLSPMPNDLREVLISLKQNPDA